MKSRVTSGGIIGTEMLWGLIFGTPLGAIYGLVVTGFGSWASVGFVVGLLVGAIGGAVLGLLIGAALAIMHAQFVSRGNSDPGSYRLGGNLVCAGVIVLAYLLAVLLLGFPWLLMDESLVLGLVMLLGAAFLGTNLVLNLLIREMRSAEIAPAVGPSATGLPAPLSEQRLAPEAARAIKVRRKSKVVTRPSG